jgi:hypothetical protein
LRGESPTRWGQAQDLTPPVSGDRHLTVPHR